MASNKLRPFGTYRNKTPSIPSLLADCTSFLPATESYGLDNVEEPQDPGIYLTTAGLAGGGDQEHQQQAPGGPLPEHVDTIRNSPVPENITDMRSYWALVNQVSNF